jgi:hypothetical protein
MLESLFGNASAEKALFYLRRNRQGYAKAMAVQLDCALTPLQSQLKRLERGGLVVSRAMGRTRVYEINPSYYFRDELLAILDKGWAALPDNQRARYDQRLRPRRAGKP